MTYLWNFLLFKYSSIPSCLYLCLSQSLVSIHICTCACIYVFSMPACMCNTLSLSLSLSLSLPLPLSLAHTHKHTHVYTHTEETHTYTNKGDKSARHFFCGYARGDMPGHSLGGCARSRSSRQRRCSFRSYTHTYTYFTQVQLYILTLMCTNTCAHRHRRKHTPAPVRAKCHECEGWQQEKASNHGPYQAFGDGEPESHINEAEHLCQKKRPLDIGEGRPECRQRFLCRKSLGI
jgi:hypothetical protein